ncbi:FAD dependent oxidoreductase [Lipomyces orientalis]|uniref:FAD dependent oxidoreductase n=1 Tax=Lipomyces orientalis TaxID=1233043 RepID=A0ACC3TQT1_9ASCO
MTPPSKDARILIVGAGEFGLSTAYFLLATGYSSVTILDRTTPPVPDGSSVDISRIVRADYDDIVYTNMVVEALELWKTEYKEFYYPCGLLSMTPRDNPKYLADALANVSEMGLPITQFNSGQDAAQYLKLAHDKPLDGLAGYLSHDAGWAYASKAIEHLFRKCMELGAIFIKSRVDEILYSADHSTVTGVKLDSNNVFICDFAVIAAGAWTDTLVPSESRMLATGQPVAFIQLTEEEYSKYKHLPIYINFVSGFYVFPPHPESHVVKAARHSYGYTNYQTVNKSSSSRESSQPPEVAYSQGETPPQRTTLPQDAEDCLRHGLAEYFGRDIAKRDFVKTRICWYNDTPAKDFLFDYLPGVDNLFIATGGSGHGFKFLPVIGKYSVGSIERTLPAKLLDKFKWGSDIQRKEDLSRGGTPLMTLQDAEAGVYPVYPVTDAESRQESPNRYTN